MLLMSEMVSPVMASACSIHAASRGSAQSCCSRQLTKMTSLSMTLPHPPILGKNSHNNHLKLPPPSSLDSVSFPLASPSSFDGALSSFL